LKRVADIGVGSGQVVCFEIDAGEDEIGCGVRVELEGGLGLGTRFVGVGA
jgi:hypothetical protein